MVQWLTQLQNSIQQLKNTCSAYIQILFAGCLRFATVKIMNIKVQKIVPNYVLILSFSSKKSNLLWHLVLRL